MAVRQRLLQIALWWHLWHHDVTGSQWWAANQFCEWLAANHESELEPILGGVGLDWMDFTDVMFAFFGAFAEVNDVQRGDRGSGACGSESHAGVDPVGYGNQLCDVFIEVYG